MEEVKYIFPWSDELKEEVKINSSINFIDLVVRIDIAFSKGLNGKLSWYNSDKHYSKEEYKNNAIINGDWNGYEEAILEFKEELAKYDEKEKQVPIDFLTADEKKKSWHSFDKQNAHLMNRKPGNFEEAQSDLSYRIFRKTNIKQIFVFPNFAQEGFGSNCIVALSDVIKNCETFILLAECVGYSYTKSLEEFSTLLRKEAIKSAKAAIMSRNISHNLGSHVMAYMKQNLSSVQDLLKNGVLKYAPLDGLNMEETEIPYLVGISKFLSYLQERQDYIATVSTDYIPYPSMVNFKDAIYDELNPDYRFQRHPEWTGHKPANILLENIAKSEGLSRKTFNETQRQDGNNILIKYRKFDGLNHVTEKSDYEKLRQWNFSLPGGIMGRQAIFSIVENVIRNAAKHGTRENGEDLSITFDIFDPMVEDNSVDNIYYDTEDIRDLYVVTLTTSTVVSDKDLEKIRDAINDSLIEENGQLKQSNKGIKEMLISASWLRNIKIEDLEHDQMVKRAPILRAYKNLEEKLYYVFCLPKVKAVALITDRISEGSLGESVVSLMRKKGWYIFTVADYLKCQNKDFCFVIIDSKRIVDNVVVDNDVAFLETVEDDIKKNSHNRYFVASNYTNIERHRIETNVFDIISGFNNEECFEEAELNLYKQLADEPDFKIAIADTDFRKKLLDQNALGDVSELVSVIDDGDDVENYQYVYRKHNDTAKNFKEFIKECGEYDFFHKLDFVEGITGGNSTDRIVRHSGGLDNLWAYKQVHAMKIKVAIFDERIFTKITGYEMADLGAESVKTWGFEGLSVEDAKNCIYSYDEKHQKKIKDDVVYEEWDNLQSLESVVAFADKYYPLQSSMGNKNDNINSMVFHKKGIDVFTLTWEKEGRFNIWGFVPEASMEDDGYGKIENVGVITLDDHNKPTIELYADSNNYHYLSIHQGLLDKVYEKISSRREVNELKALKLAVTKGLHGKFVKCTRSEEDDYLQGLIIHSGRSKPNEENMPQHQPFVQYSAIENAVFDCKYTLVELLDFACF